MKKSLRYFRHFQFRKRDFSRTPEIYDIRFVFSRPRLDYRDRQIELQMTFLESLVVYYIYECNESSRSHFQDRYDISRLHLPA